jgi:hypothetical protein
VAIAAARNARRTNQATIDAAHADAQLTLDAVITDEDIPNFNGDELRQLAGAGRLQHLGIGPDKRLRG